jgi:hypothetical protein
MERKPYPPYVPSQPMNLQSRRSTFAFSVTATAVILNNILYLFIHAFIYLYGARTRDNSIDLIIMI